MSRDAGHRVQRNDRPSIDVRFEMPRLRERSRAAFAASIASATVGAALLLGKFLEPALHAAPDFLLISAVIFVTASCYLWPPPWNPPPWNPPPWNPPPWNPPPWPPPPPCAASAGTGWVKARTPARAAVAMP